MLSRESRPSARRATSRIGCRTEGAARANARCADCGRRKAEIASHKADEAKCTERTKLTPRNTPCTCGSGEKYKHCCGKNALPCPASAYSRSKTRRSTARNPKPCERNARSVSLRALRAPATEKGAREKALERLKVLLMPSFITKNHSDRRKFSRSCFGCAGSEL
ncbi:MAG: motif [Bryobacterales bacterium]|nr:motif [Bryobacterales bacterium]